MKRILWLGIVPLVYGLRLLWNWTVVDLRRWKGLPTDYRKALPLRILSAVVLITVGLYLSSQVAFFLASRYDRAPVVQQQEETDEAWAALASADYEEAERLLRHMAQTNPDDPSVWDMLGNALFGMGRYDEALEAYDKGISVCPQYANTYYDRGSFFLNAGDYDKAIPDLRKAVELDPDYPDYRTALGAALVNVNQLDEAVVHLEKAAQKDSEHATARMYLGIAYKKVGKDQEATEQFQWILDNQPDSFEADQLRRAGFTD